MQLVTMGKAAEILGLHRVTVWRLVQSGELPVIEMPPTAYRRAYSVFDLDEVIALRDRRAQAKAS